MELKLFEEQMRAKKFDKETGKRLHAVQAARPKTPFVMDGTTFDAEGNPLISQKVVALDTPTKFATGFLATAGATSCGDSDLAIVTSTALDVSLLPHTLRYYFSKCIDFIKYRFVPKFLIMTMLQNKPPPLVVSSLPTLEPDHILSLKTCIPILLVPLRLPLPIIPVRLHVRVLIPLYSNFILIYYALRNRQTRREQFRFHGVWVW